MAKKKSVIMKAITSLNTPEKIAAEVDKLGVKGVTVITKTDTAESIMEKLSHLGIEGIEIITYSDTPESVAYKGGLLGINVSRRRVIITDKELGELLDGRPKFSKISKEPSPKA